MKKIVIVLLVVFAFSWISVVSAGNWSHKRGNWPVKESPESAVICWFPGIAEQSVLGTINVEQCTRWTEDTCAPCITSLEEQGCNIVDVVVTCGEQHPMITF